MMELMPILRAQLTLPAAPPPVAEAVQGTAPGTTAPVTPSDHAQALQHPHRPSASFPVQLSPLNEGSHPATDARIVAEAARKAYIRASIAAGVSPLPLPGA